MAREKARLRVEYEKALRLNGPGNLLSVPEVGDKAPETYRVRYCCEGVTNIGVDGTPFRSREHVLEVELKGFPARDPRMRFLTPVWHPGVAWGAERLVDLKAVGESWAEAGSVAEALVRIGEMLQYKRYTAWLNSPGSAKNLKAVDWLIEHAQPHGIIGPDKPLDARDLVVGAERASGADERVEQVAAKVAQAAHASAKGGYAPDAPRAGEEAPGHPEPALVSGSAPDNSAGADAAAAKLNGAEPTGTQGADAGADARDGAASEGGGHSNGLKPVKPKVVFGELTPDDHSAPFPFARLLHWKPTGKKFEVKEPPFGLVVTSEVLAMVNSHVSKDLENEVGGFLLGNRYVCPNSKARYIQIDNYVAAKHASGGPISLDFVNATFQHFLDEKDSKYRGKEALGWYHSHPGKGVFLSPMDDVVHKSRFPSPWTVALVIDPNKGEGGFFCWREGELHPHALMDFYELREVKAPPTVTYMPWADYQCFDSQTGEERLPQLAEGAGLDAASPGAGILPKLIRWVREYRAFVGVAALLLLALILGARAGLLGGKSSAMNSNVIAAPVGAASMGTGGAASMGTGGANAPAGAVSRTPSGDEPTFSVSPPALDWSNKEDYQCTVTSEVAKKPRELLVEVDGQKHKFEWKGNKVVIDISDTTAMRYLREQQNDSRVLIVSFADVNNPTAKVSFPLQLSKREGMVARNDPSPRRTRRRGRTRRSEWSVVVDGRREQNQRRR